MNLHDALKPVKKSMWQRKRTTGRKADLLHFLPDVTPNGRARCATNTGKYVTASDGTKYAEYSDGSLRKMGTISKRRLA